MRMTSREKLLLTALCAFAALAGGAGVNLFAARSPSERPSDPLPATARSSVGETAVRTASLADPGLRGPLPPDPLSHADPAIDLRPIDMAERLAFIPGHAVRPLIATLSDSHESETLADWLADTTVAPAPPSIVRLPDPAAPRLPWQQAQPQGPARVYTLAERLKEISPGADARLKEKFDAAHVSWRPAEIALVAIKDAKTLELYARPAGGAWTFIHRYPVLAASGGSGPKLRRGDKQVPEGLYRVSFLNPNSRYHVSLRVDFPNAFDRRMGARDGRKDLGGDIMIHGKAASIGCLAVGDTAAEELFVLAAATGLPNIRLIIAPTDFRNGGVPAIEPGQPAWLPGLYTEVASAMSEFKAPPGGGLLSFFSY